MRLIPDLREFIELLNSESVRYLVIGGWAYKSLKGASLYGRLGYLRYGSQESGCSREVEVRMRGAQVTFESRFLTCSRAEDRGGTDLFGSERVVIVGHTEVS